MGYTPPWLDVRKVSGGWSLYSPGATTDDLTIYPNQADSYSRIVLNGNGACQLFLPANAALNLYNQAVSILKMYYSVGTDCTIESVVDAKDLYLATTGTGVLKFGTYTAGAATDSTGYITIKDAAGNTRKLMVQA